MKMGHFFFFGCRLILKESLASQMFLCGNQLAAMPDKLVTRQRVKQNQESHLAERGKKGDQVTYFLLRQDAIGGRHRRG